MNIKELAEEISTWKIASKNERRIAKAVLLLLEDSERLVDALRPFAFTDQNEGIDTSKWPDSNPVMANGEKLILFGQLRLAAKALSQHKQTMADL